jgi:multidrug efflux pump
MVVGTGLGVFFIPLFFVVIQKMFGGRNKAADDRSATEGASDHA